MPSQFFGLQIGYSGLTAYQAALNTTGNNIANVETKGYSRQVINQTASLALRTHTTYGMAGSGTTVNSIDQIRNSYYDSKYRNAASNLGEFDIKAEYNAQIENYFNDDGESIQGFSTVYDDFYTSLEDVQNNPGDVSTRTVFVSKAKALCEYFNETANNLENLQIDVNTRIKTVVEQIDSIGERIATLNHEINIIELKGMNANELRDERNNLVDELSKYIDVEVHEDPVYTSDELDDEGRPMGEKTGTFKFTVIIAGNNTLVEGYKFRTLDVKARDTWNKTNQSDADGLYDIYWRDTGIGYYPVGRSYSGQLGGLLQIRDGNNNESFNGSVDSYGMDVISTSDQSKALTDLAKVKGWANPDHLVKIKTSANDEHLQDPSKLTLNEEGVIDIGNGTYRFDGWIMDKEADGTISYIFHIADDDDQVMDNNGTKRTWEGLRGSLSTYSYINDGSNPRAWIGEEVDYQGIPYYQEQMNEWIRLFAKSFNGTEQQGGEEGKMQGAEDMYGNPLYGYTDPDTGKWKDPVAFFVADKGVDDGSGSKTYGFYDDYDHGDTDEDESAGPKTSLDDTYRKLKASNFMVNSYILNDAGRMSATFAKQTGDGALNVEASDIIKELEALKGRKNFFRGCTSAEFLNCVLGDVALNANSANVFKSNYSNIQTTVENQRLSVSGVDTDEEAMNLVKYQNAYNLSAKMIQVMTEIYDRLILETGV